MEEKASVRFDRNDKFAAMLTAVQTWIETGGRRDFLRAFFFWIRGWRGAGWRRKHRALKILERGNRRGCARERREISPLRRPTPSQERRWKKRHRSASVEMTGLRRIRRDEIFDAGQNWIGLGAEDFLSRLFYLALAEKATRLKISSMACSVGGLRILRAAKSWAWG